MADKESTVYIVDVGKSMGQCSHGRSITDLEFAMQYVWDRVTAAVATGRKTTLVGVIGLKTDGTSNSLQESDGYSNISVFQYVKQTLMSDIRKLRERICPSRSDSGDAISSIVVAVQMTVNHCRRLKYKKKIVLVTNGLGAIDTSEIGEIARKIKEESIELVILGVDFDDLDYGFREDDKPSQKRKNEAVLRDLAEGCDGIYGTIEQAVSEIDIPRVRQVRPTPTFKGFLQLGDPAEYDTALRIPVERYFRTYPARPPPASAFVLRLHTATELDRNELSTSNTSVESTEKGESLVSVRPLRSYQISDENAPGGKVDVERDELAKGYEYGRTAVHISEIDQNITTLETLAALELVGFIQAAQYDRYLHMSNVCIIIAERANDKAALALSSFVHALFELESYAVARLVTKENKPPLMVLLAPSIEPDYECLLEVQLPFAEDARPYRFPPLHSTVTAHGDAIKKHRNLPDDDLVDAMEKYVDDMELAETDENGERIDSLPIDESFSAVLHRIDSAIRYRAIHPDGPVPAASERLIRFSRPPRGAVEKSQRQLEKLIAAAGIQKIPPKARGLKRTRDTEKPLSGLDVEALLHQEKRTKISPSNAIPEFKQSLSHAENVEAIRDAVKQMMSIIEDQIHHSLGDASYDRVIEELKVVREEMISYEEPDIFNTFLKQLKRKLLDEKLGGDRQELWWLIRRGRLGLIDQNLSDRSEVMEEEAREFMTVK